MTIEPVPGRRRPAWVPPASLGQDTAVPEDELTPRVQAMIASLHGEVEMLRKDLQAARDRLAHAEKVADQDQLLPILNRRAFVRELTRHIALTARYGMPACLLYLDLDGFKGTNDAYGHAGGDAVLEHFASILCANIRGSDVIGRLGGDEFGVILAQASAGQAAGKAKALTDTLSARPAQWNGVCLPVEFSFGTYELSASDTAEGAIMEADRSMYLQKRRAR